MLSLMALQPVRRRSAAGGAYEQLLETLVAGEFGPGEALPAERTLTEVLGINRQAVREALQRLAQAGLIRISQGEPTRALDYRRSGGLDLLPHLLVRSDGTPDVEVGRAVMEMRACIGIDVARRAAQRVAPEAAAEIVAVALNYREAKGDPDALVPLDLDLWDRLVDAADNIAYRLAFNSMRVAYEPLAEILGPVLVAELSDVEAHVDLAHAVQMGDADLAAERAEDILSKGTVAVNTLLAALEEGGA
jgi:GntR family transcriptional repressor for pyruvate dehydrogenase complex